ncbi:O-acetylhomoserine aminocarboxypropyltransferase [Alkalispirochaeta sphaeroplastigenens]|uniref:O-acetylhomoserine aminocarboxypropyltransferase n=1 Tax=Alkalispirochaeta sphaeroplastigenens TaxID=1187066 RepID=A0A2S4JQG1_9SPIO|nr:O-acetylhomoserine aminocarboxypropyltransferase/cysteine synthase family protein [Alkalispirochaeta sphaeroplastigenens]POR01784.1 O-acetylhomoserine aminocarboxypropyltransferase [Alkalispirochaeta sphaeroplastigenens]
MSYRFETLALHAGQEKDPAAPSRGVAVHRTTAYNFRDSEHAANLFSLKELGYIYTRLQNPTQNILEERVSALEGGAAALALASGTSAIYYAIINVARAGDEIVSSRYLYGGTYTMFTEILPQFGITVRLVDPLNLEELEGAITPRTRAVFLESIGNPTLVVPDFEAIGEIAHRHRVPLIVDSTFTTPYLLRPLDHGADIVVHSLTKWIGGHGTGIGGVVVDKGTFDWKDPKFVNLVEPDGGYHGLRYAYDLGDLSPLAYILRMRLVPLRNLGAAISPDNAWMFLQGLETLPLRMERHSANAERVARFLADHPQVEWVWYPGLEGTAGHDHARRYLPRGFGGMVTFGISGGRAAGERFIDGLSLFSHVANVGDAKSLAIHPAGTTHSQLNQEQQERSGVRPELVRLSIGIEHPEDILEDLERGFAAARG